MKMKLFKTWLCFAAIFVIGKLSFFAIDYFAFSASKKSHPCCPCCSFEYQEKAMPAYCPNCGKKINNVCSNCGRSFENDKKIPAYCPDCGTKQLDSKEK